MVHKVVAGEPELKLLALRASPSEVFEQRQVTVPETRPGQGGENKVALLTRCNNRREAGGINILIGLKPLSGIASSAAIAQDLFLKFGAEPSGMRTIPG